MSELSSTFVKQQNISDYPMFYMIISILVALRIIMVKMCMIDSMRKLRKNAFINHLLCLSTRSKLMMMVKISLYQMHWLLLLALMNVMNHHSSMVIRISSLKVMKKQNIQKFFRLMMICKIGTN